MTVEAAPCETVTGVAETTPALAVPLTAQEPAPTPANAVEPSDPSAEAPAEPASASAKEEVPSVSSPPASASAAAGSVHAKAGVVSAKSVAVSHGAASTVMRYQKGKSLTVKTPAGSLVEYRLGKGTILPDDLGPGRQVLVETKIVKKHRVATKVSYAEGRVVLTNVN